jgi:hypothetical protein
MIHVLYTVWIYMYICLVNSSGINAYINIAGTDTAVDAVTALSAPAVGSSVAGWASFLQLKRKSF